MSGHVRFGFAAFLVVAGFATPAAANAITDFFAPNPAPEAATPLPAPAAAPDDCLRQPGPAASGGHWVYRYDGHRKCWFQAEKGTAEGKNSARHHMKNSARHHIPRRHVAADEDNEPAPRRKKAVEDARDEQVSFAPTQTPQVAVSAPAPAEKSEQTPSAPKLTVVHAIPVRLADAAAQVPPVPARAIPAVDQPSSEQPTQRQVDVEKLLADSPPISDEVASAPPATPVVAPTAETGAGEERTASWPGVLLLALGAAALLGSNRTLRQALWFVGFPGSRTELPEVAHDDRGDPAFGSERIPPDIARRQELLDFDPQSVAPLAHAARTRRADAPELPSREAFWEEGIGTLAALASPVSSKVSLEGE